MVVGVVAWVQDPAMASVWALRERFTKSFTVEGSFDTHPNPWWSFPDFFETVVLHLAMSQTSSAAAQTVRVSKLSGVGKTIHVLTGRQICGESRRTLIPSRVHQDVIISRGAIHNVQGCDENLRDRVDGPS